MSKNKIVTVLTTIGFDSEGDLVDSHGNQLALMGRADSRDYFVDGVQIDRVAYRLAK